MCDVGTDFVAINAGSDQWNYQIRALATKVVELVPGTEISINAEARPTSAPIVSIFRCTPGLRLITSR